MSRYLTVNLPDIGEGVVEGEIIEWLKQVGESVAQDEPVVIVMTDKATVELPSPQPGKLSRQYLKIGEIAIRDKPLYEIEMSGEASQKLMPEPQKPAPQKVEEKPTPFKQQKEKKHALAAPSVRKLAKDIGVDIDGISGSGIEGRVSQADIVKYYANNRQKDVDLPPVPRLEGDQEKPLLGVRNLMAKKMTEAHRSIPHFSYFEEVDATRLVQLRQSFKEEAAKQGISVTYMPFIIRALSLSLAKFAIVNSYFDSSKNTVIIHSHHNIGIAITTKQGLIVPVLKDVQKMSLQEIIRSYEELKNRALSGKLRSEDMKDSTITISNFGVLGGGGIWATPIINYPEVAILGLARIHKHPIVRNGAVVIRDMLNLSWSYDHRVIDGDLAATFSHYLSTLLQNPAPLL